jgi:hypothetical protein
MALVEDGREQIMGYHMFGEIIGLDGVGDEQYTCQAVALEDSEVCVLPFRTLDRLAADVDALRRNLSSSATPCGMAWAGTTRPRRRATPIPPGRAPRGKSAVSDPNNQSHLIQRRVLFAENADINTQQYTPVFIVDDVPSMRTRLRELVGELPGVTVLGDAGTPSDAIAGILCHALSVRAARLPTRGWHRSRRAEGGPSKSAGHRFRGADQPSDPQYRRACMDAEADRFFANCTEFDRIGGVIAKYRAGQRADLR